MKETHLLISRIYANQKSSSKRRNHNKPTYTKQELKDFLYNDENFAFLLNEWYKNNFESEIKPSVDRIDNKKGYNLDNIQVMTWKENREKGYKERHKGKECSHYKEPKHYETKEICRGDFKKYCKRYNLNFNDFEEIWKGIKTKNKEKKYNYKLKEMTI